LKEERNQQLIAIDPQWLRGLMGLLVMLDLDRLINY
jgi:hypothetical protein